MKEKILAVTFLVCSFAAFGANSPSQSTEQFCADRSSVLFSKNLTHDSENLMAFQNFGGLARGGVCWWHSRFQRNAIYLTIFKPAELRPTQAEVEKIVGHIRSGKNIVEIPGFRNFSEFSAIHQKEIQRELEKWQKSDGILKFNWAIGLSGDSVVSAEKLKASMDELYQYVEVEGNIAYQKLQIKGIVAHAWLVTNMKTTYDGYDLEVIDSNFQNTTSIYSYKEGQTHFEHYAYGSFTPYLERKGEMEKLNMVILKKCNPEEYKIRKAKENATITRDSNS